MRESLKPIEAGCRALMVARGEPVMVVIVDGRAAELGCRSCRAGLPRWWVATLDGDVIGTACECSLIRIDPDADMRDELRDERVADRTEEIEGRRDAWLAELARRMEKLC